MNEYLEKIIENELPVIQYDLFSKLDFVEHGFTTRLGGVSEGIFSTMNLSFTRGDNPEHVMRNYDLRLTETKQKPYRKYSYENRLFVYEGIVYKIIMDDGSDIILAEEVQETEKIFASKGGNDAVILTGRTKRFALSELKTKIANKNSFDTYWILH